MFDLSGRTALVTGASGGIGTAITRALAEAGCDIAVGYVGNRDGADDAVRMVEKLGRRATRMQLDQTDSRAIEPAVERAARELGRLDILVNNAGGSRPLPIDAPEEKWYEAMTLNFTRVRQLTHALLPHMIERRWGRLLATSSIVGAFMGWAEHVHYTSAKGGVAGLVRGLALEVARHGITVNAIAPGVIETPQSLDEVNSMGPELVRDFGAQVPVGRVGRPEDVAALYAYLASDEAAYLTGQVLLIDGGISLSLGY